MGLPQAMALGQLLAAALVGQLLGAALGQPARLELVALQQVVPWIFGARALQAAPLAAPVEAALGELGGNSTT